MIGQLAAEHNIYDPADIINDYALVILSASPPEGAFPLRLLLEFCSCAQTWPRSMTFYFPRMYMSVTTSSDTHISFSAGVSSSMSESKMRRGTNLHCLPVFYNLTKWRSSKPPSITDLHKRFQYQVKR